MYKNIGKKIKLLAKICGLVLLAVGVLGGAYFAFNGRWPDDNLIAPFFAVGIVGFLSSWPLYGFGELIENVQSIAAAGKKPENGD